MAELKTKPNNQSVTQFLDAVQDEGKRADSYQVVAMIGEVTGVEPRMWGDSIIGFGDSHYKYASGREGDWFVIGFSPRKQNLTIYLGCLDKEQPRALLARLGKHKMGKGCLYINKLQDVDLAVLQQLIEAAAAA